MKMKKRTNVIWTNVSDYFMPDLDDQRVAIEDTYWDVHEWEDEDRVTEAYWDSSDYETLLSENSITLRRLLRELQSVVLPGSILAIAPKTINDITYYHAEDLGTKLLNIFEMSDCFELEYYPYSDNMVWYGYRNNIHCDTNPYKSKGTTIIYKVLKPGLSDIKKIEFANLLKTRGPENSLTPEEWSKYTDSIGKHLTDSQYKWLTTTYDRF